MTQTRFGGGHAGNPPAGGPVASAPPAGGGGQTDWESAESWQARSRIVLTPVAAPSILGFFGFAGATFMVASLLAGWWGDPVVSPPILAPFVLFFGGLAQLLAGMWAYKARDAVATAMHGTWGSFWLAYGLLILLVAGGVLPAAAPFTRAFGFWFIVLAVVTIFGALASLGDNLAVFVVLGLLAAGSSLLAAGLVGGNLGTIHVGGWVLVASAAAAFYTAGALMLAQGASGRTILPLGRLSAAGNIPGRMAAEPVSYPAGMPGSRVGQ